jgi:hypothetical protein
LEKEDVSSLRTQHSNFYTVLGCTYVRVETGGTRLGTSFLLMGMVRVFRLITVLYFMLRSPFFGGGLVYSSCCCRVASINDIIQVLTSDCFERGETKIKQNDVSNSLHALISLFVTFSLQL